MRRMAAWLSSRNLAGFLFMHRVVPELAFIACKACEDPRWARVVNLNALLMMAVATFLWGFYA